MECKVDVSVCVFYIADVAIDVTIGIAATVAAMGLRGGGGLLRCKKVVHFL